jgi:hypothetical protein
MSTIGKGLGGALVALAVTLAAISCTTGSLSSRGGAGNEGVITLVIYNHSGVSVRVADQWGHSYGRITGSIGEVKLRGLPRDARFLFFTLTGDRNIYRTFGETLINHSCWEVDIEFMSPGRSIEQSFLPCGMGFHGTSASMVSNEPEMLTTESDTLYFLKRVRFAPTVFHLKVATEVSDCMEISPDLGIISWYLAEAIFNHTHPAWVRGAYFPEGRAIVLTYTHSWNPVVIRHEMIHFITGLPDPLPPEILEKCESPGPGDSKGPPQ